MKLKLIGSLLIAATFILSACKYEEGPAVSLRSKRDRISNEWHYDKFMYNGVDVTNQINTPQYELILSINRMGGYEMAMVKPLGGGKYETTHTGNGPNGTKWSSGSIDTFTTGLPHPISYILWFGDWSFDKGHYKIQLKPELSYDESNKGQVLSHDWTIQRLAQKELKVWGQDDMDIHWEATLSPINE